MTRSISVPTLPHSESRSRWSRRDLTAQALLSHSVPLSAPLGSSVMWEAQSSRFASRATAVFPGFMVSGDSYLHWHRPRPPADGLCPRTAQGLTPLPPCIQCSLFSLRL